ncbi:UNVERIFIED_CONTAM: Pentatricopeptide repeat-containing protein [Sesamum angustifolium]|uniref:Pentatricopeptide repeat-containing protein n=1 Tax=Sesamum angustifolium TaxID=2727405 RepID=A0AAW2NLS2_9LAMI
MNGPCPPLSHTLKHLFSATAPQCESLLYRCATTAKSLATTKKLHAYTITSGILSNHFLSLLTSAYGLCGQMEYACRLFDQLPKRTPVACKAIIRMYTENGYPRSALELFVEMHGSSCYWADDYTYPFVVRACGDSLLLELGMVIHGLIVKSGFVSGIFVGNSLLAMYMTCGDRDGARRVFDAMKDKTVVSWNTMISGSFRNGSAKEALMVFRRMVNSEMEFDSATVLSVLPACGYLKDLEVGREVHLLIKAKSFWKRLAVQNALLDMYVKCGRMDEARGVFDGMVEKDVVTWTTVIHGYILNADVKGALELCRLMQFEGVRPNEVTLASLLAMCADLQDLKLGKCLHGWAIRQYIESDVNMETALIDLYAKCSSFRLSLKVFSRTSKKRTVPWNAILSEQGHCFMECDNSWLWKHGHGTVALSLFNQMVQSGVKPNEVTFTSALHACGHAGLVDDGLNLYNFMQKNHPENLRTDHYTCIVDLLGRADRLEEAYHLINTMPFEPSHAVWGALLGACAIHENVELGEVAAKWLFKLEPENTGNYILLGNIYSAVGRFDDAEKVRKMMDDIGLVKAPANSMIEVRNL